MYILINCLSHLPSHVDSLHCIFLMITSFTMFFFLLYVHFAYLILLLRLYVDMDDVHVLCMTNYCMHASDMLDCMLMSMWDTHVSPYL